MPFDCSNSCFLLFYYFHFSIADEDGQCGGILTEPEGQIVSVDRNGDGLYDPHLSCITIIAAPKNIPIEIIFIDFNLTGSLANCRDHVFVSFCGTVQSGMRSMSYVYIFFLVMHTRIPLIYTASKVKHHTYNYYFRDVFHMRFSSNEQSISNIVILKSLLDLFSHHNSTYHLC